MKKIYSEKDYFAFVEWIEEMQVLRMVSKHSVHVGKWVLSNPFGQPVYLDTAKLFQHFLKNKTLTT